MRRYVATHSTTVVMIVQQLLQTPSTYCLQDVRHFHLDALAYFVLLYFQTIEARSYTPQYAIYSTLFVNHYNLARPHK